MTQRLQSIVTLTICSLLGVSLLQAYFGYQVYQQHTVALEREVDRVLSAAIQTADEERVNQINGLFEQDLRNPSLVKLDYKIEDGEPRIFVSDPQTGGVNVSIRFREEVDSATLAQQLLKDVINYNRSFLTEGSVMYWTDELGERLGNYSDSIQLSKVFLEQAIRHELDTLDINSDFELSLSNDSTAVEPITIESRKAPAKIDGYTSVAINLTNPGWEVLRRSGFIYLMSVIVLLLVTGSFLLLVRFVRRQKRLSQLKDDFIDNVTHELLTPITTLKLALDTLRQDDTMDVSNKYLKMSEQQAQRIAEVVDHILQVSFNDEEQAGLNIEDVNLNNLIEEALEYYRITTQKPLDIHLSLPQEYIVLTDAKHLQNVVHNLIGNAVKYSSESGVKLSIEIEEADQKLCINVTDNGPGIPAADRQNIFDKFHRVTNGSTHEVKGLGIGLYYARQIMDQLGGALKLLNTSPAGSTFSIILPHQNDNR